MKEVLSEPPIKPKEGRGISERCSYEPKFLQCPVTKTKRELLGMRICNRDVYCNYTMVDDHVKATASSYQHQITTKVTFITSTIIYLNFLPIAIYLKNNLNTHHHVSHGPIHILDVVFLHMLNVLHIVSI